MVSADQAHRALTGPAPRPLVRWLGRVDYSATWQAMRDFTDARTPDAADQFWCLEHFPVFTQGQRGRAEHVLAPGDIPVVPTDRGGQVTYHGPGQLVVYPLVNLQRLGLGPRGFVSRLEQAMTRCLSGYGIEAQARADAPGVYVAGAKIGSIGLRIRRGCSYHGLSLNVAMDLEPFARVNPCGMQGLRMTQLGDLGGPADVRRVAGDLLPALADALGLELASPVSFS